MRAGDIISAAVLAIVTFAAVSIVVSTLRLGISPMPSSRAAREVMLDALPRAFSGTIVDLGAGFGLLALAAARRFPDAKVVAYEGGLVPWVISRLLQMLSGARNLELVHANFVDVALGRPDVVLCYLFPRGMQQVADKLGDFRPRLLVSNTFALPKTEPTETIRLGDLYSTPIYIYRT